MKILNTMKAQENAWNNGDIESFMLGYWESKNLQFVGKKGVTKGYQETLANYKKSYPGKEGMGSLSFDILSVEKLSEDYCFVTGKYSLVIGEETPSGHFTLLWKKINGEWVIISDHSS